MASIKRRDHVDDPRRQLVGHQRRVPSRRVRRRIRRSGRPGPFHRRTATVMVVPTGVRIALRAGPVRLSAALPTGATGERRHASEPGRHAGRRLGVLRRHPPGARRRRVRPPPGRRDRPCGDHGGPAARRNPNPLGNSGEWRCGRFDPGPAVGYSRGRHAVQEPASRHPDPGHRGAPLRARAGGGPWRQARPAPHRDAPVAQQVGIEEIFVLGSAPGATPFATLLETAASAPRAPVDPARDLAVLPYSSGTTGFPKGVVLTHRNLVANLLQTASVHHVAEQDRIIAVLPFFHIYGMQVVLNLALWRGATLVTMPRFELEPFLATVQQYRITRAFVVPPLVLALAQHPAVDRYDLSSLRAMMSGAAPLEAAGWLRTGDIGRVDWDGYFTIVDRLKELIKYKGFQVPPAELEALLRGHPAVADAAVVPLADRECGEVPKAFVVLRGDVSAADLMAYVAERVAPYKRIRALEVIDAIPKSPSGKILRRVLKERGQAVRV